MKKILLILFLLLPVHGKESPKVSGFADSIVVNKGEKKLMLFVRDTVIRTYTISLGKNPKGPKTQDGDCKTPEGRYTIDWRNSNSHYHLALHISYPNAEDIKKAKQRGVLPGGSVMIHGMKNGLGWIGPLHLLFDWTNGCVAVTNKEMDEIWNLVKDGTPIIINP